MGWVPSANKLSEKTEANLRVMVARLVVGVKRRENTYTMLRDFINTEKRKAYRAGYQAHATQAGRKGLHGAKPKPVTRSTAAVSTKRGFKDLT